jgi:glycosylphosphatidylinositol transamidase (GPIT) subunit GPI8
VTSVNPITRQIPLTHGKVALVDNEDYERVTKWKWFAFFNKTSRTWYAYNHRKGFLHRFIMDIPKGTPITEVMIDHENHDGLDCRRRNIRRATHFQNQYNANKRIDNTSGFRGVVHVKTGWHARIRVKGT